MRLAYLSQSSIPSRTANSIHVMKMCQGLARAGADVTLFAPAVSDGERGVPDLFAFYGVEECFKIRRLAYPNSRARYSAFLLHLSSALLHDRPDIVFGRSFLGCMTSVGLRIPTAFEAHSPLWQESGIKEGMLRVAARSDRFRKLVVISDALRRAYVERQVVPPGKIMVAHDGADDLTDWTPADLPDDGTLRVGYVGNLYPGRGIELILAMAKQCPWASFHVVGGQDLDVRQWRAQAEFRGNVHFHGFLPHPQAVKYRLACDVLLAPYARSVAVFGGTGDTSAWMSPIKLFEYMASRKAIICSDLPVLREVLHDENAVLAPVGDVAAWVSALVRLRDVQTRERLAERALADFRARHQWSHRAATILSEIVV